MLLSAAEVLRVGHILGFPRRRSLSFVWQLWGWCNAWSLQLNSRKDWSHQKRRLHHVLIVTSDPAWYHPAWYPVILLSCLCFGRCQAWLQGEGNVKDRILDDDIRNFQDVSSFFVDIPNFAQKWLVAGVYYPLTSPRQGKGSLWATANGTLVNPGYLAEVEDGHHHGQKASSKDM